MADSKVGAEETQDEPEASCRTRNLLKLTENVYAHENLYTNLYSSSAHNCQKLEVPKISFNRWMDKPWYSYTVLFSQKKRAIKLQKDMRMLDIAKWKKSVGKGYILHDPNYVTFWKKGKIM